MDRENIQKFLDYNYVPLTKPKSVVRLLIVFLLSGVCMMLQKKHPLVNIGLLCGNLIILCTFIYVWRVGVHQKNSRFLWDGVTHFYMPIILNLTAYSILTWNTSSDLLLLVLLMLTLVICYLSSALIVFLNIRRNRYAQQNAQGNPIMPSFFALVGFLFAKTTLKEDDNQLGMVIIVVVLLLISSFISVGWTNIIRLILNRKIHNS